MIARRRPGIPFWERILGGSLGSGRGGGGDSGSSYTYYNLFRGAKGQKIDAFSDWIIIGSINGVLVQTGGRFYTQALSSTDFSMWTNPPVPLAGNDQWASFEVNGSYVVSGDRGLGVIVRGAFHERTGYALYVSGAGTAFLYRADNNSYTTLDEVAYAPNTGDIFEIQASGTTITGYHNGTVLLSAGDSNLGTGGIGIIARGLDTDAGGYDFKGGDLPKGDAARINEFAGNMSDGRHAGTTCLSGNAHANATLISGDIHYAVPHAVAGFGSIHFMDFDLKVPVEVSRIRNYQHSGGNVQTQWDDVDVWGSDDGTAWVNVGTALNFGTAVDGDNWAEIPLGGTATYRHWKVGVKSTLNADDWIQCNEIQFGGGTI